MLKGWESIDKGNDVEKHEGTPGGLVEEQLHAVHLQLSVVAADPNCIQGRGKHTAEGKEDAQGRGSLNLGVVGGERVVVRDDTYTHTDRDKSKNGLAGESGAVQDEVHERHDGSEQDSRKLVEGNGREGEREVRENDVQAHGDAEGEHSLERNSARGELVERRSRKHEERKERDGKVEAGETELAQLELGVREDRLVGEDLCPNKTSLISIAPHSRPNCQDRKATYNSNSRQRINSHPSQRCSETRLGRFRRLFVTTGQKVLLLLTFIKLEIGRPFGVAIVVELGHLHHKFLMLLHRRRRGDGRRLGRRTARALRHCVKVIKKKKRGRKKVGRSWKTRIRSMADRSGKKMDATERAEINRVAKVLSRPRIEIS